MNIYDVDLSAFEEPTEREQCGIIVCFPNGMYRAIEATNRADKPGIHFRIMKAETLALLSDVGLPVVWPIEAVWHTHRPRMPKGPSYADCVGLRDIPLGVVLHQGRDKVKTWYSKDGIVHVSPQQGDQ